MALEIKTTVKQIESDSLSGTIEINTSMLSSTTSTAVFKLDDFVIHKILISYANRNSKIIDIFKDLGIDKNNCSYLLIDCKLLVDSPLSNVTPVRFKVTLTDDVSGSLSSSIVLGNMSKLELGCGQTINSDVKIDMFQILSSTQSAVLTIVVGYIN